MVLVTVVVDEKSFLTEQLVEVVERLMDLIGNGYSSKSIEDNINSVLKAYINSNITIVIVCGLFLLCLGLLLIIYVFFGYKLYKSLTERQRKKDEKRKQKQLKKKK